MLLVVGALAARPVYAQPRSATAITGVTVIDVERGARVSDQTVVVTGARITAVGPRARVTVPVGATVIDGRRRFLMPGLWDMHTHSLDRWRWTFPLHVAHGVTGIRDLATSVPLAELLGLRADVEARRVLGPRFVAAGPLIDGPGSTHRYLVVRTAAEARAAVDSLADAGADFIKVYERLPLEAFGAVIESARRRGLPVVGHVPEAVADPSGALTGAMRSIEHA
jgi:cytosine/adenosine deaminase-related metal-dependent hydrolase